MSNSKSFSMVEMELTVKSHLKRCNRTVSMLNESHGFII